jgi:hypothetical protein
VAGASGSTTTIPAPSTPAVLAAVPPAPSPPAVAVNGAPKFTR